MWSMNRRQPTQREAGRYEQVPAGQSLQPLGSRWHTLCDSNRARNDSQRPIPTAMPPPRREVSPENTSLTPALDSVAANSPGPSSQPAKSDNGSASRDVRSATVLLVDDDRSVRESLSRVLVAEGYHVLTAASVSTAVHRLSAESVDLVITDLRMPKVNGLDLLFHYHFQRPRLPIFVITALPTSACQGAEKIATAFFPKPLDCDVLLSAVRRQLASRAPGEGASILPS